MRSSRGTGCSPKARRAPPSASGTRPRVLGCAAYGRPRPLACYLRVRTRSACLFRASSRSPCGRRAFVSCTGERRGDAEARWALGSNFRGKPRKQRKRWTKNCQTMLVVLL
eukprot:9019687-Pyramimonas_sp.AAC.1